MIPRKATAWIFLAFSVLVVFKNYLNGEYQYILLVIPFIAAVLSREKISQISEIVGLLASSVYIMSSQVFHVGLFLMIISSIFFFTLGIKLRTARVYIGITVLIVAVCSYFQFIQSENMILRALFDSLIYAVCSFCVYIALQDYIASNVKKAIDIAERAIEVAEREDK